MPICGIIGSDLMKARPDWKIIGNPFAPDDPIVVVPAIRPDIALFHAPEADRFGNVRIGRQAELAAMAYAAKATLVTVERIRETSLLADENSAAGVLPALYVTGIAEARNGAWPLGLWGEYLLDDAEVARYARMAKSAERLCRLCGGLRPTASCGGMSLRPASTREILIAAIADLLTGVRTVAVGASSPIPAAGAMLLRARNETRERHADLRRRAGIT